MKSFYKNNFFLFIAIILVIFILAFFFRKSESKPFGNFLRTVTRPFSMFFAGVGMWVDEKTSFWSSIGELKIENEKFLEENIALKSELADLKDVKDENRNLREELQLAPRDKYQLAAARIIGKDMSGNSDVIFIDKGSNDGIEKNMGVVVGKGVLIGKVVQTSPNSSQVELILSKNSRVNAEIEENGAKGIVKGEYGTASVMDMIPQTVQINSEDTIITSGLGSELPRGLLIGYVKEAMPTADQLFQKVSIILPVQLDKLRIVWVIKK